MNSFLHSSRSPIPSSKSKKQTPESESSSTPKSKLQNPSIATRTPTQPSQLPPRFRNRRVALSLKEVRQVAAQDGANRSKADSAIKSARRQISSWPEDSTTAKEHKPRKNRSRDGLTKIPEKYEMLGEFFDNLDSSIRLSRMKGSMSTFSNISPKIESLTDRRFSLKHLAQLKYIMPEAIEIKRVLRFDERTSCMKPDLHVSVNADAVQCDDKLKSQSKNIYFRKVFRERLADFYRDHPQGDDIPVEMLPEPFNRLSLPTETPAIEEQRPAVASLLSRSFQRRFSQKTEAENTLQKSASSTLELCTADMSFSGESCSSDLSPTKLSSKDNCGQECLSATPSKEIDSMNDRDDSSIKVTCVESTPAKLALSPVLSKITTPSPHPQKRCTSPCDGDSFSPPNKFVRRPPSRSLIFETPKKHAEDGEKGSGDVSDDDEILKILPESLLQSIREKELKAKEEQDPAISQAKRRRQMISYLPKLFNMIHFMFQSTKQSIITKAELIHKIIANHTDIVDRREIEEQLNLLLELVPEWISEKLASSGDLLLRINKMSNPEALRAQLEEAK